MHSRGFILAQVGIIALAFALFGNMRIDEIASFWAVVNGIWFLYLLR